MLGWFGVAAGGTAIRQDLDEFRRGSRALDAALFAAATEDEGAAFHGMSSHCLSSQRKERGGLPGVIQQALAQLR